jgi:hypothetical protein
MAQGWQSGAKCFETIERAGADACARAFGVTNSGLLSCSGYAVVGNEVELTLSSGTTTPWTPTPCQFIDYSTVWGPMAMAALVGCIVIWGIKEIADFFRVNHEL